jgi:hypothetical protein
MALRDSLLVGWVVLAIAVPCTAQTRGAVVVKGGAHIERAEDGIAGESPAAGADLLVRINDRWDVGVEVWYPGYFTTDFGVRHRDIQFTVGARRLFGEHRVKPFFGFGLGVAVVQEKRDVPFDFGPGAGATYYLSGGADVPLGTRFVVIPEIRVTFGAAVAIVRPAIGFGVRF